MSNTFALIPHAPYLTYRGLPYNFPVGNGWHKLCEQTFSKLYYLYEDYSVPFTAISVTQIKEKYGGLRLYVDTLATSEGDSFYDEFNDILLNAESNSYHICEECGEKGTLRSDLGWILTLCDTHYQEVLNQRGKFTIERSENTHE